MQRLLLLLAAILVCVLANTSLDNSYCPFPEGNCTHAPIAGEEFTGPPYTGSNADPYIAEAVGSGSVGRTCNFNPNGTALSPMPQLYKDLWLLAASQDLYNGRHLGESSWAEECAVDQLQYSDADTGANMCGAACGQCFIISGPKGSGVFIVNEIADIGAVGQNGRGLNFHLDDDHSGSIRAWNGVSKDIYYKPVPCPVSGGMSMYMYGNYGSFNNALYMTILNHKNAIKTIHTRGGPGGNQTWVPLARDWTNRWHYESYGCATCPSWQNGYGPIDRGSTAGDFELKVTSIYDESMICTGLLPMAAGTIQACVDTNANPVQFTCGGGAHVSLTGCGYNTTLVNGNYYAGNTFSDCGVSKQPCATKGASTGGSSDASSSISRNSFIPSAWLGQSVDDVEDPLGLFL